MWGRRKIFIEIIKQVKHDIVKRIKKKKNEQKKEYKITSIYVMVHLLVKHRYANDVYYKIKRVCVC